MTPLMMVIYYRKDPIQYHYVVINKGQGFTGEGFGGDPIRARVTV